MQYGLDIAINVGSALLGVLLAAGARVLARRYRFRGTRIFWAPLLDHPWFVVGAFESPLFMSPLERAAERHVPDRTPRQALMDEVTGLLDDVESSKLIGRGDLQAALTLNRNLSERDLGSIFDTSGEGPIPTAAHGVVVIGSDDVNPWCRRISEALGCTLRFDTVDHRNVVRDLVTDVPYAPGSKEGERSLRTWEYAVLVRGRIRVADPEREGAQREMEALLLAGTQGHGTLAAARACFELEPEIRAAMKRFGKHFEALIRYERIFTLDGKLKDNKVEWHLPARPITRIAEIDGY